MKRQVITTSQFKRDARRALKRGWPETALREVILHLAEGKKRPDSEFPRLAATAFRKPF